MGRKRERNCPHCQSSATRERPERTKGGDPRFRYPPCPQGFTERPGTLGNHLPSPTEVVGLVVLWRERAKGSLGDLNTHKEQDQGGITQGPHPMCGFKSFVSAERFCRVDDEVRHFFRARAQRNESVSWAWHRALQVGRMQVLLPMLAVA